MDNLGAIAICSEPYEKDKKRTQEDLTTTRISKKHNLLTRDMWRTILGQSAYQFLVIIMLMYFGTFMFFEESFNLIEKPDFT